MALAMAGHETTGTTLAWAFYWLCRNPPALARLRDELAALPAGASAEDVVCLPWLEAVTMETLRHNPLIPLLTRRLAASANTRPAPKAFMIYDF